MKVLISLVLLFVITKAESQQINYVVFEETPFLADHNVDHFKLRYTDVKLQHKTQASKNLHIYNFYYAAYDFVPGFISKKAFTAGAQDYRKFQNDVLITLTPLTDSLETKLVKLSNENMAKLNCLSPKLFLQNAISNLYDEFTKNDMAASGKKRGQLKTMQYKLIIKRGRNYFLFEGPTLTEMYMVDGNYYLFPNQYHYGEINPAAYEDSYFSQKAIMDLEKKYSRGINNSQNLRELLYDRVYPSHEDSIFSLRFTRFNTLCKNFLIRFDWKKSRIPDMKEGIGAFDFVSCIGIINGSYDFYIKNYKSAIEEENDDNRTLHIMNYQPVSINRLSMKDAIKTYYLKYPRRNIYIM